jgi:trimeric autotransporter adhesin
MKVMKKIFLITFSCLMPSAFTRAQSVGIGTSSPNSSAQLDITSTSKGFLLPRMSTAAITSISNPAKGLLVLDTSKNQLMVNIGTNASPNWQTIVFKSGWSLTGNSNIDPVTQFIGTTDANPLQFKVNNTKAGFITSTNDNIAFGLNSMSSVTTGHSNSAIGGSSLNLNTTGSNNTAIGYTSLPANTTGLGNTAVGSLALHSNITAGDNTAVGADALYLNTTGQLNTALGSFASYSNNTGSYNVAIGQASLSNNVSGSDNISLGVNAGPCNSYTNLYNTITLGNNTCNQNSNYAILSTPTTVWNGGHVTWSTYSDGRIKRNIKEDVPGITFIMKLRPVTYNRSLQDETNITGSDTRDYPTKHDVEKIRFTGFVAQDVEKAAQESNFDFSGITKPKTSTDLYSLSYESFVVPLVKAVQEQQAIIEKQQQKIDDLETRLQAIEKMINKL